MPDHNPGTPRGRRRGTVAIIAALVIVVVAAIVVGVVAAQPKRVESAEKSPAASSTSAPAADTGGAAAGSSGVPTTGASRPASSPASTKPSAATSAPAPQPTKTAQLAQPAVIVKALTAKVTKQAAVSGKAQGPGEIAGPSVRFTIAITNTTGKTVDLSNAVVNAYYGGAATPATQLEQPGGQAFPASVKDGATATGAFVFNIPTAQRSIVQVTLDTSVANAVVAFKGAAPR